MQAWSGWRRKKTSRSTSDVERRPTSFSVFIPGSYVVSIDGSDPVIRWQLERGLDWTISSVAGESYRVDVSRAFGHQCLLDCIPSSREWKNIFLFFFVFCSD